VLPEPRAWRHKPLFRQRQRCLGSSELSSGVASCVRRYGIVIAAKVRRGCQRQWYYCGHGLACLLVYMLYHRTSTSDCRFSLSVLAYCVWSAGASACIMGSKSQGSQVSLTQVLTLTRKWPTWKAAISCAIQLAINVILQVVFVLAIRGPYHKGVDWPVITFGVLALVVLLLGYVPIPFELIKRRGRITGISLLFLVMDWNGAFFSLMSLGTLSHLFIAMLLICPNSGAKYFRYNFRDIVRHMCFH
jgi:hypothetical protein